MRILPTSAFASAVLLSSLLSAQWTPLSSGLQQIRSITSQSGALYAVTFPTGVRKSVNGGTVWTPANTGITQTNGNYFVESVGVKGSFLFAGAHAGIFKSNDGGASWTNANGALTASNQVYANKFFSFGNELFAVFAGTIAQGGGVYRTSDNGAIWNIGHSGMGSNATVYHITSVGAVLYACTSVGIYTSVTQGQSWTPLPSVNYAVFGLAASGSNLVIVSTFGLRYSTNNGGAWTDCGGTPTSLADGEIIAFDGKVYAIVPNQTGCYRSIDAGLTFGAYGTGLSAIDAISLEEFFADGTKLYTGAFTDIYSITGTSTTVNTVEASGPAAYVFPTVFEERFTIVIPEHMGTRTLILIDAQGKEVRRMEGLEPGEHVVPRQSMAAGTLRCVLMDPISGHPQRVGTLIAR
ncbi:MAG: hypothetical protein IPG10_16845 [Flavobacteriales bacterium]|nr:hypothetical protein [Flavobacteriales bacterium]